MLESLFLGGDFKLLVFKRERSHPRAENLKKSPVNLSSFAFQCLEPKMFCIKQLALLLECFVCSSD